MQIDRRRFGLSGYTIIYLENKMNPIFKKLNYKNQSEVVVLNAPESFNSDLNEISELTIVKLNV